MEFPKLDPKKFAEEKLKEQIFRYETYIEKVDKHLYSIREIIERAKKLANPRHKVYFLYGLFKFLEMYCQHWCWWLLNSEEAGRSLLPYADELNEALDKVLEQVLKAIENLYEADKTIVKAVNKVLEEKMSEIAEYEALKISVYVPEEQEKDKKKDNQTPMFI